MCKLTHPAQRKLAPPHPSRFWSAARRPSESGSRRASHDGWSCRGGGGHVGEKTHLQTHWWTRAPRAPLFTGRCTMHRRARGGNVGLSGVGASPIAATLTAERGDSSGRHANLVEENDERARIGVVLGYVKGWPGRCPPTQRKLAPPRL